MNIIINSLIRKVARKMTTLPSIPMRVLPKATKEGQRKMSNNCHKKGHYKADCLAEGGGKEGQGPKMKGRTKGKAKKTTAAVAAKEKVKEKVEAWMVLLAVINEPESSFDAADLSYGSNLSDDDWFEEMDNLPNLQPVNDSNDSEMEENLPDNLDDMDSLLDLKSVSDSKICRWKGLTRELWRGIYHSIHLSFSS
jgi:hypothetical protein